LCEPGNRFALKVRIFESLLGFQIHPHRAHAFICAATGNIAGCAAAGCTVSGNAAGFNAVYCIATCNTAVCNIVS
jgi:hypothetical protein